MTGIDLRTLEPLYSAVVSDACDRIALRGQTAVPRIVRRSGAPQTPLIGWARTALSVATPGLDGGYAGEIRFVDSLGVGDVVVGLAEGEEAAFWGELFSAAAIGRGARGAVIDGLVRDVEKIEALGFPVFAAGARPTDCNGRIAITQQDQPLVCGGVQVASGDLVVADSDGIVFVPQAAVSEVVNLALEKARTESDARELLMGGGTLAEVWERHRVL